MGIPCWNYVASSTVAEFPTSSTSSSMFSPKLLSSWTTPAAVGSTLKDCVSSWTWWAPTWWWSTMLATTTSPTPSTFSVSRYE